MQTYANRAKVALSVVVALLMATIGNFFFPSASAFVVAPQRSPRQLFSTTVTTTTTVGDSLSLSTDPAAQPPRRHQVNGIDFVEVVIPLPFIGDVTILEATASAQDALVDLALENDEDLPSEGIDDDDNAKLTLPTGDPYGAVLWPAASVVAITLLSELSHNTNVTVLELGAGTGLVSLAAIRAGCPRVIAADYEKLPLQLIQYAAQHLNPCPPVVEDQTSSSPSLECMLLDMCDFDQPLPVVDYVVAADVMYEPVTGRAVARRVVEALRNNSTVIVGDSPGRAGRPAFLKELQSELGRPVEFTDISGWTVTGPRNPLICDPESPTLTRKKDESPRELMVAVLKLHPKDYPMLASSAHKTQVTCL
jgi:predicted nicotinamide N-methyase